MSRLINVCLDCVKRGHSAIPAALSSQSRNRRTGIAFRPPGCVTIEASSRRVELFDTESRNAAVFHREGG